MVDLPFVNDRLVLVQDSISSGGQPNIVTKNKGAVRPDLFDLGGTELLGKRETPSL